MDVVSHALWTGAAVIAIGRRQPVTRAQFAGAIALSVVPDLGQLLPVAAWAASQGDWRIVTAWISATPGHEPAIPHLVRLISHHLHCIMHSAVIASVVTAVAWRLRPTWLIPLLGWWLHIAIDIPTHSNDYYAVPFLYPFTYWSVSGVAWTTPWLLAADYAALAFVYVALYATRRTGRQRGARGAT